MSGTITVLQKSKVRSGDMQGPAAFHCLVNVC